MSIKVLSIGPPSARPHPEQRIAGRSQGMRRLVSHTGQVSCREAEISVMRARFFFRMLLLTAHDPKGRAAPVYGRGARTFSQEMPWSPGRPKNT